MQLWQTLDRYLPDEQIAAMLGGARSRIGAILGSAPASGVTTPYNGEILQHVREGLGVPADVAGGFGGPAMVAPGTAPAPMGPAPAYDKATDGRPSIWQTIDLVLGGNTITDAREILRKREIARRSEPATAAAQADLTRYVSTMDPRERAIYLSNPDKWAELAGEELKPRKLTPGDTEVRGDGSTYTAPVMGVNGDQGFTQTPDAFVVTGRRDPTFEESSQDADRRGRLQNLIAELAETVRHNQVAEGIDRGRIAVDRDRLAFDRSKVKSESSSDISSMSTDELLELLGQPQPPK